jgi:hypothetical protein
MTRTESVRAWRAKPAALAADTPTVFLFLA